jgi:acetyltransferase-like isoleucine patch superfamily enzyme
VILGSQYIQIGENFLSFAGLRIEAYDKHMGNIYTPKIIIGNDVSLNYDCHIGSINRITIGNNVLMASKIFITDHFHGDINSNFLKTPPAKRIIFSKGPVIIEDNVWIGEGAAIMPNVKIGRNSIIGANAVVTNDIPPNCVAGGVPARVIRRLETE